MRERELFTPSFVILMAGLLMPGTVKVVALIDRCQLIGLLIASGHTGGRVWRQRAPRSRARPVQTA